HDWSERAMDSCAREGIAFEEELVIRNAHGDLRAVRLIGEPQRDEQGRIVRIEGAFQDITERKQALEGLISSQQRFRQLADAMPQIVWTANPDGGLDYISQAGDQYTGMPLNQSPQDRWVRAVHPEDFKRVLATWKRCIQS